MSLAPPWAKPAAILGLKLSLLQLRLAYEKARRDGTVDEVIAGFVKAEIESYCAEIERIEGMKS